MHESRHNQVHPRRRSIVVVAAIALVATWAGCSVDKHYEMLSFFFDGVPDPNAPKPSSNIPGVDNTLPILTVHPPYAEMFEGRPGCPNCHTDFSNLAGLRGNANLCLKCHEGVPEMHPRMHGPVAAMACLLCHNPHQSPYLHLLRKGSPEVCQQCHQSSLLTGAHTDDPSLSGQDCLRCHSGHGGSEAGFLLEIQLPREVESESSESGPEG